MTLIRNSLRFATKQLGYAEPLIQEATVVILAKNRGPDEGAERRIGAFPDSATLHPGYVHDLSSA
jgi:hypothetical protein